MLAIASLTIVLSLRRQRLGDILPSAFFTNFHRPRLFKLVSVIRARPTPSAKQLIAASTKAVGCQRRTLLQPRQEQCKSLAFFCGSGCPWQQLIHGIRQCLRIKWRPEFPAAHLFLAMLANMSTPPARSQEGAAAAPARQPLALVRPYKSLSNPWNHKLVAKSAWDSDNIRRPRGELPTLDNFAPFFLPESARPTGSNFACHTLRSNMIIPDPGDARLIPQKLSSRGVFDRAKPHEVPLPRIHPHASIPNFLRAGGQASSDSSRVHPARNAAGPQTPAHPFHTPTDTQQHAVLITLARSIVSLAARNQTR